VKRWLIVGFLLFSLGACMGTRTASPSVDYITVTKTKIIKQKPEVKTIVKSNPACVTLYNLVLGIEKAAETIDLASTKQLDFIQRGHIGIVEHDMQALTDLETDQRRLSGQTTEAVQNLAELLPQLQKAKSECNPNQ
jgi:hypothetical protein